MQLIKRLFNFVPIMDTREKILKTAEHLFAEHGFEGTSIRMLALKAEVNLAMVSYYFGSKEKLFEAIVLKKTDDAHEKLLNIRENIQDPWEQVERMTEMYIERILTNHRFHKILQRELSLEQRGKFCTDFKSHFLKNVAEMVGIIRDGQKKKVFLSEADPEMVIATLMGTISQITLNSAISLKIFGEESVSEFNNNHKNRLKTHLLNMLKAYLLK